MLPTFNSFGADLCTKSILDNYISKYKLNYYNNNKEYPYIYLNVNGKNAKMLFDTGASINVFWDNEIIGDSHESLDKKIITHVHKYEARYTNIVVKDPYGNESNQVFYLTQPSILAEDGYSGIVSPQAISSNNDFVIDFIDNCFFISKSASFDSLTEYNYYIGPAISNDYDVLGAYIKLDGKNVPLVVDSGAPITSISASLISTKPIFNQSMYHKDAFGAVIPEEDHMRSLTFKLHGMLIEDQAVQGRLVDGPEQAGIESYGYIGMDVLKNKIIIYDKKNNLLTFLTSTQPAVAQE